MLWEIVQYLSDCYNLIDINFRSEEWDGGPGVSVWWEAEATGAGGDWLDGVAQEEGWDREKVQQGVGSSG